MTYTNDPPRIHKEGTMESIVTIHRPELTPEERAKRMKAIEQAAIRLIVATERSKIT